MSKRKYVLLLFLIYLLFSCSKQEKYTATYKKINEAVYASGRVVAKNEYKIFSLVEGILAKKIMKEGAKITEGEPLFIIEADQQNSRTYNATEIYAIAQKNYQQNSPILLEITASIENARNKMLNDSLNFQRFKNLLEQNATSRLEFDKAKLNYQNAKNDFLAQKNRYEKTRNQLLVDLQNAENQYKINQKDLTNYVIKSNTNGILYKTFKEEGELVKRGENIAIVGAENNSYIQLDIDEIDINKIKIGQNVILKTDLYPNQIFKAKITKIYQMMNEKEQNFRVDAEFSENYNLNFVGITIEANILIQTKEKALVVPKSLIVNQDSIWIEKNNKIEKVKIKKGIENYDWVEILDGLDEKTILIKK
jgi:multidrug resistance efflux pump